MRYVTKSAYETSVADVPDWRQEAACAGHDPELWFFDGHHPRALVEARAAFAKKVCAGCPVRDPCLAEGFQDDDRFAIRGGLDADERKAVLNRAQRRAG